ncbi:uncharacterized protein LOC112036376 [Quercus suber]|uniref:uncharacterized protein LOC112036376 n=1 Tax=Quercus suber TaxID=58331 RepID=UPI000CE1B6F8|nr:uncharacterized protein LOC112036376 [Quercus suber]POE95145.1 hypothetical protein CFP56_25263 [Quercus suber]
MEGTSSSSASSSMSASLRRRAPRMCYCPSPAKPVLVVSWTENNPGRRFYGCPNYWVGRKCKFFQWVDDEICAHGKVLIPKQRQTILRLEDEVSTCKKREKCLTVSLILALMMCGICLCVILALVD